ncbi:uncharacterized protein LOC122251539 [Penaeus japonicus]|uniref:uncharacterized protein LOC122251539 n=1 Tax=Penaeus japonicus TaxID=27405 RepID=UPI001C70D99A|nr:uncharacterized protein LOC122251539 [Penaeus japonicus]XP_042869491.1 uncharacterized protein LOC122251539 [Penaeus japonicus]XP_042869492.1 uncharacterized protein LOC122251539 [Penaeus japonicus]XP_042869493.1 uncharacterized protein LOC122251539 [Penaeus japonicus]
MTSIRKWAWAAAFLGLVGVIWAAPSDTIQQDDLELIEESVAGERDEKFFVAILKISPDQCTTNDATRNLGTCLPTADCSSTGGVSSGSCAKGFGACCIAQRTCGESTSYNNTYFVNPGYTGSDTGTGACMLTVNRVNNNICQLRLDFLDLELEQPDADGNCNVDFLTVTGGTSTVPRICGSNTGQHMYVDVDPNGGALKVTVDRSAASTVNRSWNIKVTQIACDSQYRAPSGCLQYYTETSGYVESFNFDNAAPTDATGTRQIANQDYGICVEMEDGYCGIIWERNSTIGDNSFTVSGNVPGTDPTLIGTAAAGSTGAACTTDYVIIPGGVDDNQNSVDRFCGLGFPNSVTSTMKPFVLYVHTDADEATDVANRGFNLQYRQITDC